MHGPFPKGHWKNVAESGFRGMKSGRRYRVIKRFVDYEGHSHEPGTSWIFLGSNFVPYEDGQCLFVSPGGDEEWQINLQWRPEAQAEILENWEHYVVSV